MADYYHSEIRRAQGPVRRRSLWGRLLDGFAGILSLLTAAAMLLTYVAPHIRPTGWFFPVLSLVAPATYVLTVLLTLYWIVRWHWAWASVLLVLVAAGFFHLSLFLKLDLRRDYEREIPHRGTFSVMTYNVRLFYGPDGKSSLDSILSLVRRANPDILCLQEFYPRVEGRTKEAVDERLDGYYSATGLASTAGVSADGLQQVIYSRFPILRSGVIDGGDTMAAMRTVWADLLLGDDTLRVYDNHLRTTQITSDDDDFLTRHRYLSDTARDDKIRSIVRRFRDGSIARAAQADSIAAAIAASPYPRIVCGDFNDTPMSYTYHVISRGLTDAFRKSGKGFSHTYRGFNNTFRIDYVLLSPELEAVGYEVPDVDYSDHHPVLVRFKITKN